MSDDQLNRYNLRNRQTIKPPSALEINDEKRQRRAKANTSPPKFKKARVQEERVPLTFRISEDLMLDILRFTDRNEVDKCQLISRTLHKIIEKSPNILALYLIEEIHLDESYSLVASILNSDHDVEIMDLENQVVYNQMYKTVAKGMRLSVMEDAPEILEKIEQIVQRSGRPLNLITCDLLFTKCHGFEWLENIPRIFEDLISTAKLTIMFHAFDALLYAATNPKKCLKLNQMMELNIESVETCSLLEYDWLDENGTLQRFLSGHGLEEPGSRKTIRFANVEENEIEILQAFIKVLKTSPDPSLIFQNYLFTLYNRDEQRLSQLFTQNGFTPYKAPVGRYQNYEREDEWIIEVDFCHENKLEFAFLKPEQERRGFNER